MGPAGIRGQHTASQIQPTQSAKRLISSRAFPRTTRPVGHEHQLACASTDANVPIALGVPAVALGAGGRAGDAHLPTEWYENDKGALGIVRALLVTVAMAEAPAA